MSSYDPKPPTDEVARIPKLLTDLIEKLAEVNHDAWARQRLDDGWKLGPARNDERKEHPCLVPYDALPEGEKEYDRRVASANIRAILSLGFEIKRP